MINTFAQISTVSILTFGQVLASVPEEQIIASHEISLENRYPVKSVSEVFKDNILLNIAYMEGRVSSPRKINWDEVKKPFQYRFVLEPNKTFAFHDDVLEPYKASLVQTTRAHFNASEGFKSDGYLFGDGVCHLASLMYWVAKDAGLDTLAPTNHDFMNIPEVSREYGVSIFSNSFSKGSHAKQNLYITNNKEKPITFKFDYNGDKLKVSVAELN